MRNNEVAYNDAARILFNNPVWDSASKMVVNCNIPTFRALFGDLTYTFRSSLIKSKRGIIMSLHYITKIPALIIEGTCMAI